MANKQIQLQDENGNNIFPQSLCTLKSTTGWPADTTFLTEALNSISTDKVPNVSDHSITSGEVYTSGPAFAYTMYKFNNSYYSGWVFSYTNDCIYFAFHNGTYHYTRLI